MFAYSFSFTGVYKNRRKNKVNKKNSNVRTESLGVLLYLARLDEWKLHSSQELERLRYSTSLIKFDSHCYNVTDMYTVLVLVTHDMTGSQEQVPNDKQPLRSGSKAQNFRKQSVLSQFTRLTSQIMLRFCSICASSFSFF
jgi:hypothetical protein